VFVGFFTSGDNWLHGIFPSYGFNYGVEGEGNFADSLTSMGFEVTEGVGEYFNLGTDRYNGVYGCLITAPANLEPGTRARMPFSLYELPENFSWDDMWANFSWSDTPKVLENNMYIEVIPPENIPGDANEDGQISLEDYALIKTYLQGGEFNPQILSTGDINGDGAIDAFDLFEINKKINNVGLTDFTYTVTSGNNAKITKYVGNGSNVKVPAVIDGYNIIGIDNYAFKNNTSVHSVTLAQGIKTIGYGTFLNCTALETVELPDTVTNIGTNAFKGCTNLTKITIPASVTSVQPTSFNSCPNVTIYGQAGSYAETYANNNSISFVAVA
jgi:hypothetical protein